MADEKWFPGKATIGSYIRAQRELARLSLRELARISHVSNAYLSQVERGMHEPSLRVLAAVAEAL
jgi:transcriptional regulator with XRE-family HTH domain